MEDVAKAVGKTEQTVKLWLTDPAFRQILLENAAGAAIRVIVGCLAGEHFDKDRAMVALGLLRLGKVGRPKGTRGQGDEEDPDDPGLGEFSKEQLERLVAKGPGER